MPHSLMRRWKVRCCGGLLDANEVAIPEDIGETHFGGFMKKKGPLPEDGEGGEEVRGLVALERGVMVVVVPCRCQRPGNRYWMK